MLSNSDPKNDAYKDFVGFPRPERQAGSGCFGVRFVPVLRFISHRPWGALRISNAKAFNQRKAA
jgi:hypothetical protein